MFKNTILAATMIAASAFAVSTPANAAGFSEKDITFLIP